MLVDIYFFFLLLQAGREEGGRVGNRENVEAIRKTKKKKNNNHALNKKGTGKGAGKQPTKTRILAQASLAFSAYQ